jgi:hypothetical protein
MKKRFSIVFATSCLFCTTAALAGSNGWYVLGEAGQNINPGSKSAIDNAFTSIGAKGFSSSMNLPVNYNLDLGYQVSKNFALEGGYLGASGGQYSISGGNVGKAPVSLSGNSNGLVFRMVGMLPVVSRFSLLGKFGIDYIHGSTTTQYMGNSISYGSSKANLTYGLGAKYDVTRSFFARLDIDRYVTGYVGPYSMPIILAAGFGYRF